MSQQIASGHVVQDLEREEEERLKKNYFMYSDGVIRLQPGNWMLSRNFLIYADGIYNFEVKPTDVFVLSYPKSGTTWTQEIVWNLVHNADLDNPKANIALDAKFPNFEADMYIATTGAPQPDPNGDPMKMFTALCPGEDYLKLGLLKTLAKFIPPPRMLKNHLPLSLLSPDLYKTGKTIYVARDPRDVICSLYHYVRLQILWGYRGTLDEFVDDVVNDRGPYSPYWSHIKLAWDARNHPNFHIVFYEDMKKDTFAEVKRISEFLGLDRTDQQMRNVVHTSSFTQMKEKSKHCPPTSNDMRYFDKKVQEEEGGFFRKGETGDWKNRFTPEQVKKLNSWMAKNLLQFGDDFKYKI